MPQLIAIALAGAAAYAGYRWVRKQNDLIAARRKSSDQADSPRDLGDLVWDEATGAYRPRQDS